MFIRKWNNRTQEVDALQVLAKPDGYWGTSLSLRIGRYYTPFLKSKGLANTGIQSRYLEVEE